MEYCTEFEALLDLYVDGELPAEEMIRVQAHLDTCPRCQFYVDDLLAIRAAFPDAEDTIVPEGFTERVMAAVRQSAVPVKKTKHIPWKKVLLPLAACCAVVVMALPFVGMNGAKMESAPAEAPAAAAMYAADMAVAEEAAEECAVAEAPAEAAPEVFDTTADKAPAETQYTAKATVAGGGETGISARAGSSNVTLTAEEAGTLLEGYELAEETETELRYQLSAEEFDALIAALADAGIEGAVSQTDDEVFTVTVIK